MLDLNAGALAPVADEARVADLAVTGTIPADLSGTLIRNGPNPFDGHFVGDDMLSWWVAPGMLHGLALHDGQASWYRNRWVRTRGWFDHFSPEVAPGDLVDQNANVNLVQHNGQLLALGEGGLPFVIDSHLETIGGTNLGGALTGGSALGGMTAHPKVDPATGELIYFRADWQEPFLRYGVIDATGQHTVDQVIDVPGPAMMHDFAITATRSLFLDLSVAYDFELLAHGAPIPLRWHDDRVARVGITPRHGGRTQWVGIDPCFIQHVINAYDLGPDQVVLEAIRYPSFLRFDNDLGGYEANPLGVPWRYTFTFDATGSATVQETQLDDRWVELPHIDDSRVGRQHRYAYAVEQPTDVEMRGIIKYDSQGSPQRHLVSGGDQNSEPIFVPRSGRDANGAEDDGWLLFCVYRAASHTTDVVIAAAQHVDQEPVATVHLPRRIPAGFHGIWAPRRD